MNSLRKSSPANPGLLQTGAGILVAFLPKCGLCLSAYLHLAGLLGLSVVRFYAWIIPILAILLTSSLAISFIKARKEGKYHFFLLSLAGAITVMIARMQAIAWLSWIGLLALSTAALAQMLSAKSTCNTNHTKRLAE